MPNLGAELVSIVLGSFIPIPSLSPVWSLGMRPILGHVDKLFSSFDHIIPSEGTHYLWFNLHVIEGISPN